MIDPDRLAELEEERRFLLRSIADLEREREAGDIDDSDYHALRDGYTARAATVLRAIEQGRSVRAPKPPRNWLRLIGIGVAVALFGVVAGVLVARASGQRGVGDTITGGTSPDQVAILLSQGRELMGVQNVSDASQRFLAVLKIDPNNVEARTYAGWLLARSSADQQDKAAGAKTLAAGKQFLTEAISIDPTFADPYCFLAIVAGLFETDLATAFSREEECLANFPSADMRGLMVQYIDPLKTGSSSSTPFPSGSSSSTPSSGG